MRDVSTIVKDYYDTAAVPVTAAEAMAHTTVSNDKTPVPYWAVAVAAAAVVLVLIGGLSVLLGGSDPSVVPAGPSPETAEPTVTVPVDGATGAMLVTPPVDARWTFEATVDDWLTEPMTMDGQYYATSKGLFVAAQQEVDGPIDAHIEDGGELWTSPDGLTWMPAETGDRLPPASPDTQTEGAAVVVRRDPLGDRYGVLVAEGLWATEDGTSWREIALRPSQDNWIPWVATGGLGWVVYSPPRETTVEADSSSLFQGPRHGNLGLWYTPDTEAWFEVTDLGPLADPMGDSVEIDGEVVVIVNDGEVVVYDVAMIVRDTDILVYVNMATSAGWGISDPYTEIWRLDLSPGGPG